MKQRKRASQAARRLKPAMPVAHRMAGQGAADAEAVAAAAQRMMTAQACGEAAAVVVDEAAVETAKGEAVAEIEMGAALEAAAGLAVDLVQGACPRWKVEMKATFQGPVADATALILVGMSLLFPS